jgi:cytochrome c-type biogenesis protein CcmE
MSSKLRITALLASAALPCIALAHHSAARFDLSIRDNRVSGIVKEFSAANPHTKIVLEVTDEKGTRDIEYEGHSRNNYYRSGWRVGMVEPGDKITLIAAPTHDGSDGGYALGVITEDGVRF